ncbi:MAG: hypothetical protein ACR2OH_02745 [Microthrixaceae bacterium]
MNAPTDPRHRRYRPLSNLLGAGMGAVGLLAFLTLLLGEGAGGDVGAAMVVVLATIPLLRVCWLVGRWFKRGDPRFAAVGLLVVAIPVCGFLLAR